MNKILTLKYFGLNYLVVCVLTIALLLVTFLISYIPILGYSAMFFILAGIILHYHWTNFFRLGLMILSFILNFILWTAEQVNLERTFHDTSFYQSEESRFQVAFLGALLWATNKIIIDFIFIMTGARPRDKMKIELIIEKISSKFVKEQQTDVGQKPM